MTKSRVLYIVNSLSQGSGVMSYIMNIYRNIDPEKVQIDFLVATSIEPSYKDELVKSGSLIFNIPVPNKLNIKNYREYKLELEKFYFKNKGNYDIIHSHVPIFNFFHFPILKKAGYKYRIVHSHSTKSSGSTMGRFRNFFLLLNVKKDANIYFACTIEAANHLYGKNSSQKENMYLVNNGIESKKYEFNHEIRNKVRRELNLKGKFVVGHVGRFAKEKNHSFLLDIFVEIKKINKDSVLLLAGDGKLVKTIREKSVYLGIADDVIFLGLRDDINELIQAMDIFVLPSLFEGLGIVTIEAQASGLPCIVSQNVPGDVDITPIIKHVSLKNSPKHWAHEIMEHSKKYMNRKSYTNEIRKENYDIEDLSKWMERFYTELL